MNGVYVAEVYYFGSYLSVVGKTEKEVIDALTKEYCRAYEQYNGIDPRRGDAEDRRYLKEFKEELIDSVEFREFGKVEWR